jgi:hypothetical protein
MAAMRNIRVKYRLANGAKGNSALYIPLCKYTQLNWILMGNVIAYGKLFVTLSKSLHLKN